MTSFIWSLFNTHDSTDSAAECIICHKKIKRGIDSGGRKSFSTTPLHNHAKVFHLKEYQAAKNKQTKSGTGTESEPSTSGIPSMSSSAKPRERKIAHLQKQLSLEETFDLKKLWDINDTRAKEINKKIMLMMALDNQPFTIVEDEGFIRLMAHLQPRYVIPSRRYFAESGLQQLYEELRAKVAAELVSVDFVSFT